MRKSTALPHGAEGAEGNVKKRKGGAQMRTPQSAVCLMHAAAQTRVVGAHELLDLKSDDVLRLANLHQLLS